MTQLQRRLPKEFNKYFEPFSGAGALFFSIEPSEAFINDINHSLINLYRLCRDRSEDLKIELSKLEKDFNSSNLDKDKESFYYSKRDRYNKVLGKNTVEEAALFVFLNKANYNGLYRVNSKGFYNVPFGRKKKIDLVGEKLDNISSLLKNTTISEGDFEQACKFASKGDFVYFDPPYHNTFVDYHLDGFSESDQLRLYRLFENLSKKGVYCMLSNSDSDFILDLYKNYHIEVIQVKRYINRDSNNRNANEVIITNYEVNNES